jgi:hypothetical protein
MVEPNPNWAKAAESSGSPDYQRMSRSPQVPGAGEDGKRLSILPK